MSSTTAKTRLVPFLDKVKFPVVSANVAPDARSKVGDKIKPSIVLEIGGQKIGIVGAVTNETPEISSPGPDIQIEDDIAAITAEVEKLKARRRQQDHRAHPCRLSARASDVDRQDPRRRRRRRRPLAFAFVEHRSEGGRPLSDDGRQPRRLQGAGRPGRVLFEISRRFQSCLRRQRRRQGSLRRPDLPRQVGHARRSRARPHQGARRADRGAEEQGSLRRPPSRSTAAATTAAPGNARWAIWSRTPSSTGSRARASRSSSRTAAACAPRSTRASSPWARC